MLTPLAELGLSILRTTRIFSRTQQIRESFRPSDLNVLKDSMLDFCGGLRIN